jgi:putative Holliday junction resolvase
VEAKQLLGLDVGMARIGIARASSVARLAEPLMSVATDKAVARLKQLVSELDVESVVVGLPRTLNGNESNQTTWVRDWVSKVKDDFKPTFYWQDEALSTKTAELRRRSLRRLGPSDAPELVGGG